MFTLTDGERAFNAAVKMVAADYGDCVHNPVVRKFAWERFEKWLKNPPQGSNATSAKTTARYFLLTEIRDVAKAVRG